MVRINDLRIFNPNNCDEKMNKYCIDYISKNGNVCCVWVVANNEVEAEAVAKSEYSDINNVINVVKYN